MNIIFTSCGNDSVALAKWAFDEGLDDLHFAYSDTKWGSEEWGQRVNDFKYWVELKGAKFHIIDSVGFKDLCKSYPAFPTNGMAFCSYELKIKPAKEWLNNIDPNLEATCYTGVRRCESPKRAQWPEWIEESDNHGGRSLCSPLVRHSDEMRNDIIERTPFPILEHRSKECTPCVNSSKMDLRELKLVDIEKVERLESEVNALMTVKKIALALSVASNLTPKVILKKDVTQARFMFRKHKTGGAEGIRQVIDWANSNHGGYNHDQLPMFGCESGFCGD